ncbi:MAG: prepilin-type N-terminal cleavage/methylation domain-containing protein [Nibricoccus sp.]
MKNSSRFSLSSRRQTGFSLVEMIGVLAIIAVLAVIIVPKVFSTIAAARITSAASSVGAVKTAIADFAGKYGTIPLTTNNSRIDDLLFTDGLMEGRFVVKIGTQPANPPITGATWTRAGGAWNENGGAAQTTQSRVICVASNPGAAPSAAAGANFRLTGLATANLPAGARVVSAVLVNVTSNEAREVSLRIDGEALSAGLNAADNLGKVAYAAPVAGLTTVYIYIAHQ